MKLASICLVLVSACAIGGNDPDAAEEQESGSTQYVSIVDFGGTDQGVWYDLAAKLNGEFDQICGDTFCEGDFTNLTPLTFSCSVTSKAGSVHDCAWTFAGSQVGVDSKTALISIDAPTYQCHVHPKTTAKKLIALLANSSDAIHEPLPGMGSLYDSLADCFAHPIGATPLTSTFTSPPTYVEASDYYTTSANQQKWQAAKAALVHGFDNVCGDTFCGGDMGDLHSLDFACAVTRSTGNVKSCAWTFGGSFAVVKPSGGALDETSKTFTCAVAVHGTLAQVVTTLTAVGMTDAIRRPLPGGTATPYDALLGCLP